jgi:hypothetical protein
MSLSKKHRRTLQAIFAHPVPANLRWREIAAMLAAIGVRIEQREGSRVKLTHPDGGLPLIHHVTHGEASQDKGSIATIRNWLRECGTQP